MYLISRKFHPSFGIPGTEVTGTEDFQKSQMRRGWEWKYQEFPRATGTNHSQVAIRLLAVLLGVDSRSLHPMAGSRNQ